MNGHPIDLISCNSQADPNAASTCARQAVSDHVAAVVGLSSLQSGAALDILEAAKIPAIGSTDINPQDQTSPISYPIQSVDIQAVAEVVMTPGWDSCKRPAFMTDSDIPALVQAVKLISSLYATLPTPVKTSHDHRING